MKFILEFTATGAIRSKFTMGSVVPEQKYTPALAAGDGVRVFEPTAGTDGLKNAEVGRRLYSSVEVYSVGMVGYLDSVEHAEVDILGQHGSKYAEAVQTESVVGI